MADPFTTALIAGTLGNLVGAGATAGQQFLTGRSLMLDDEQKKRLKELERMAAEGELGLTPSQREAYYTQVLTPVQAAEREALSRFAGSQQIGDIGQGAAFRQQQALKEGSAMQRQQAAQTVAAQERAAAEAQDQERLRLKDQERRAAEMQRQAALTFLGGAGTALAQAAGKQAEKAMSEQLLQKRLDAMTKGDIIITDDTQSMLGIEKEPFEGTPLNAPMPSGRSQAEIVAEENPMLAAQAIFAGVGGFGNTVGGFDMTPNSEKSPEERVAQLGSPVVDQPPASGTQVTMPTYNIGQEVKTSAGWGYEIIEIDAQGNPVFTFISKNGKKSGRFEVGSNPYNEAMRMLGGE